MDKRAKEKRSAAGGAANGPWGEKLPELSPHQPTQKKISGKPWVKVMWRGQVVPLFGRQAQTIMLLIECGPKGVTSGEASPLGWAKRTAAYVHKLRNIGFDIRTTYERVSDALIGRYTLMEPVAVVACPGLPRHDEGLFVMA